MKGIPENSRPIRLGITGSWKTLHPGLQHTLAGDLVLSNQFDPLLGFDAKGILVPLAASSWVVSEDLKTFTFEIDTRLKFSDGTSLTAEDFKRSWESAVRLEPKSSNNSLLDLLYKLEGFERLQQNGHITGIAADSTTSLRLSFNSPFRMALDHLAGVRFAAFKSHDGKFMGTGRYVLSGESEQQVKLDLNPFHADFPKLTPVDLVHVSGADLPARLAQGDLDGLAYGFSDEVSPELLKDPELEIIHGLDSLHINLEVNGIYSPLFSNGAHRKAIQTIVYHLCQRRKLPLEDLGLTRTDFQILMPLQPGRLAESEGIQIIEEGQPLTEALKFATKVHPLVIVAGPGGEWLSGALTEAGYTVSEKSRAIGWSEMPEYYYKRHDYDLLYSGFSVVNGDPDGLYHALGAQGAILNPVVLRKPVAALLEEGRNLVRTVDLDPHYKKLARAILQEVPVVHLGFAKSMAIVRRDRLSVSDVSLRRNEGHVHVFKRKGWFNP